MIILKQKNYEEIIIRLAEDFRAEQKGDLAKRIGETNHDFIDRGLFNSTARVVQLIQIHYDYIAMLIEFLANSIENSYAQLHPAKCRKFLVQIVDSEYEELVRKVPSWLHESQLLNDEMCASSKHGVITKRDTTRVDLENKCALWEERWRQRRKWYHDPKWIIGIIVAVILAVLGWFVPEWISMNNGEVKPRSAQETSNEINIVDIEKSPGSIVLQPSSNLTVNQYTLIYETAADLSIAQKDVNVLDSNIVDAHKGYMRIRISKEFLNSNFNIPVTLKYESGRYEPVMLTFRNDPIKGAGIIITSPERNKNTSLYLNESFIRYKGFGPQTYTEDLVFKMYYNDNNVFMVTESAEVQFLEVPAESSYKPPPIRYGRNIIVGYFNEDSKNDKINVSSEVEGLERYFKTYTLQ